MKKILFSVISSFAFIQGHAALSNLNESILEYQTILDSSLFQTTLTQSEFIVDIKRKTRDLTATKVLYEVLTRTPRNLQEDLSLSQNTMEDHESLHESHHRSHDIFRRYLVKLNVIPNPLIGPPIITVVSVKNIRSSSVLFFNDVENEEEKTEKSEEEIDNEKVNEDFSVIE